MRKVFVQPLGIEVSALGFGCASLGSRISARAGQAAIERALEAGITWFDVAPLYGGGAAESLLGIALSATGVRVAVASKVGLVARTTSAWHSPLAAMVRPLLAAAPALKPFVKKLRQGSILRVALTGAVIRESVGRSLEHLRRDHLDVLALHEPCAADLDRDDVIAALTALKREGLVGEIAIAGDLVAWEAAKAARLPTNILQIANSPFNRYLASVRTLAPEANPVTTITHSVFGVAGALAELRTQFHSHPQLRQKLLALGYSGEQSLSRLLLDYAFASNPSGVVLVSAFLRKHLLENAASACREPNLRLERNLDNLICMGKSADQQGGSC